MRMRTCEGCGQPVELRNGRAVTHDCPAGVAPVPRRPGSASLPARVRARVIEAGGGVCWYCGGKAQTADHVIPWIEGGSDDETNLVAACRRCNWAKSNRHMAPVPTIAVLGQMAAGKSTLAAALAERTGWPVLAIDDYRARGRDWADLLADLEDSGPAVVESVAVPRDYRVQLIVRCALIVHVRCPEPIRRRRLRPGQPIDLFGDGREDAHYEIDGVGPAGAFELERLQAAALARGLGPSLRPKVTASRGPSAGPLRLV